MTGVKVPGLRSCEAKASEAKVASGTKRAKTVSQFRQKLLCLVVSLPVGLCPPCPVSCRFGRWESGIVGSGIAIPNPQLLSHGWGDGGCPCDVLMPWVTCDCRLRASACNDGRPGYPGAVCIFVCLVYTGGFCSSSNRI